MAHGNGKLTPEQRETLRRRWEGSNIETFDWLAAEAAAAWGITISRQALRKTAIKAAWKKGGPKSEPLAVTAGPGDEVINGRPTGRVAKPARVVPGTAVTVEPVDQPQPQPVALQTGEKPVGYAGTGRPSAYRPEYAQQIIAFFDTHPTKEVEVAGLGGATRIQVLPRTPPTLVRFAQGLNVSAETVGKWATELGEDGHPRHPEFADAYARARNLLESLLVEGAALGVYDSRVTQFMLKNWYGWKDQPERDVVVAPVSRELLETLYIQRMAAARERQRLVLEERARLRREEEQGG